MNLYSIHDQPEKLHKHKDADKLVPSVIWDKYVNDEEKLMQYEDILAKDGRTAYSYALYVLGHQFPKGEKAIANSKYAYDYWRHVINRGAGSGGSYTKRFPAGEKSIARVRSHAITYTMQTHQGLPEFEETFKNDPNLIKVYIDTFPFRKEAMEKYLK